MQSNVVMGDNLYLKGYWTLYVNSVCIYQKVIFYWWDDILSVVMETIFFFIINMCLVTQSCPTLCNQMDCSPAGSSVHGDSPGKNSGVGSLSLLQGIFPTQELNQGLLHYRQILYQLNYEGSQTYKNVFNQIISH